MFGYVLSTAGAGVYFALQYFSPPSNFDGPPSNEVREWMEKGGASRKAAELLIWHGVYANHRSPAARQLMLGGGWTAVTAELRIRGYEPGPDSKYPDSEYMTTWGNPVKK